MNLYNILNQLAALPTLLWRPKNVEEWGLAGSVLLHSCIGIGCLWTYYKPITITIAPHYQGIPVVVLNDAVQDVKIARAAHTNQSIKAPVKTLSPKGLKEPKGHVVPKKKMQKKVEPKKKKDLPLKKIKKEIEPIKPVAPVPLAKKPLEAQSVQQVTPVGPIDLTSKPEHEHGAALYSALQSAWQPPVGIVPTQPCVVCVEIDAKGTTKSVTIEQGSLVKAFDLAAKAAVMKMIFPRALWNRSVRFSFT